MTSPEFFPENIAFQWDDGNSEKNYRRHGVTRSEAEQVFVSLPLVVRESPGRSGGEKRLVAYGQTDAGRRLVVVFTLREALIRVISARPMGRREGSNYDKAKNS